MTIRKGRFHDGWRRRIERGGGARRHEDMRGDVPPIGVEERLRRIARAQAIMREKGIDALYLDVSSSMTYFTGLNFRRTERMH